MEIKIIAYNQILYKEVIIKTHPEFIQNIYANTLLESEIEEFIIQEHKKVIQTLRDKKLNQILTK
jgi:hypothetical protein